MGHSRSIVIGVISLIAAARVPAMSVVRMSVVRMSVADVRHADRHRPSRTGLTPTTRPASSPV